MYEEENDEMDFEESDGTEEQTEEVEVEHRRDNSSFAKVKCEEKDLTGDDIVILDSKEHISTVSRVVSNDKANKRKAKEYICQFQI